MKEIFHVVIGGELVKIKDKIRDKLRQWLLADELLKFDLAEDKYKEARELLTYSNAELSRAADQL